jgi:4-amino-4-deoxy-L-arabinose transferase-like glycosyltransferase/membrane-associated phospholipid phosphatase
MQWFQTLDATLFHWVNAALANPFFNAVMPFFSSPTFFLPVLLLAGGLMCWQGGPRGRVCVLMLALAIALGDGVVCNALKHLIGRPRPFLALADAHVPEGIGRMNSGSMPSAHACNWFAATLVLFLYYRRSLRFMLPLALIVAFSRVYNGVHYPGDVLAGAIVGLGSAAAVVWAMQAGWQCAGRRWFPLWWQRMPSLLNPEISASAPASSESADAANASLREQHWMRLAYVLIVLEMLANLAYNASGKIGLSGDEAYQWVWSKHLALSYYSKPLLIAVAQFIGTSLWGDTVFGVRFLPPIITAVMSVMLLRFLARAANVRAAFWLSLILPTVPILAAGSVLMTIDPLSVMFWVLAMIAGWRAIQEQSTLMDWFWVGLWMGLGFLSKYTALFQLLSWMAVFVLWPPSRKQLARPGPWLALLVNVLCSIPVLVWNSQHGWITVKHVAEGGQLDQHWAFTAANLWHGLVHYTGDFVGGELGLLNPFFVIPTVWAVCAFWPRRRDHPLLLYFLCMGAPEFLCYFLFTFHSRVQLNWIAPAIIPFLCLAVVYWEERWRAGARAIQYWLASGLVVGAVAVVVMHDSSLPPRLIGRELPPNLDLWQRVEGWEETAQFVEGARQKLLAEGKPVFIIGAHYSITGELSFYLPEARATVGDKPLVYFLHADTPQNQFYFWPGYEDRKGQNAIYVSELDFLNGKPESPPRELVDEFESVTDLGEFKIMKDGRVVRRLQIYECRGLR